MSLSKVKSTSDYLKSRSKSHTTKSTTVKTSKFTSSVKWSQEIDPNSLTSKSNGLTSLHRERGLIMDVLPSIRRYNKSGLANLVRNGPGYHSSEQYFDVDKEKEVRKKPKVLKY